jgi:hypothetical protein
MGVTPCPWRAIVAADHTETFTKEVKRYVGVSDKQLGRILIGLVALTGLVVLAGYLLLQTGQYCPDGKRPVNFKGNRWSCFSPDDPGPAGG